MNIPVLFDEGNGWMPGVLVATHVINLLSIDSPSGVKQEIVGVVMTDYSSGYLPIAKIKLALTEKLA